MFHDRVCTAVSDFYCGQFKDRWMVKTDSSTINVVSALLIEKRGELKVVVLTTGTTKKKECSYFMNKCDAEDLDECTWGVCDGHAESVCYRLASFYLVTEIQKYGENPKKSILESKFGFALKKDIKFHFFTTHLPCGFMAKENRHFLSWKIPFKGKPHCLKCSSIILISAYLGIQGPISQLFSRPIYISSITITDVTMQKSNYIKQCFKAFQAKLNEKPRDKKSPYQLVIPHVEIADDQSEDLFDSFEQLDSEEFSQSDDFYHLETEERCTEKEVKKTAVALTGDSNIGSHMMVFTLNNGLNKKEFHKKIKLQIKNATKEYSSEQLISIKEINFKKLKEAQVRLSTALDINVALEKLKNIIIEKMDKRFIARSENDEVIVQLKEMEECRLKMAELTTQVNKLKESFHATIKQFESDPKVQTEEASISPLCASTKKFKSDSQSMIKDLDSLNKSIEYFGNGTKSIVDELTNYRDFKETLDDLVAYLKGVDTSSCDSLFDLELMGCDWARYMKLMQNDIEKS